jgi:hypothetical protein
MSLFSPKPTVSGQSGHSSIVNMLLIVGSQSLVVSQMGRDSVYLESPIDCPPGQATLFMQVDQSERRWDVYLPKGISAADQRVEIAPIS